MATSQDTEITLGTGKLLVFFFALVVVCALFFGLGFSLGRNASGSPSANQASLSAGTERPQAGSATSQKPSSDMSFYKSVEQKSPDAQLATPEAATPANAKATEAKPPADPMTPPALSGYRVQVAAVTKPEDAEALVNALKKKQYPAFAVNNTPSDKLYRVQVGPYPDIKDAEAIRSRLVSDGYNPILKK